MSSLESVPPDYLPAWSTLLATPFTTVAYLLLFYRMSASAYAASIIYTGVWSNWSKGRIYGATLTIHEREAGLLGAFLAIYVSFVGGQFWRILCYCIHQTRAGKPTCHIDAPHRQTQVLLRNSEGAGGGFWEFARLPFRWKARKRKPVVQCIIFALVALLNLSAFGVASIFSSEVTKSAGNTTIIYSPNCGYARYPNGFDPSFSKLLRNMRIAQNAAGYARACYGAAENPLQCNTYPRSQIDYSTTLNVPCPFETQLCLRNLSVAFDTGHLETFEVFGINSPKHERLTYRRVTTCAPLDLSNFTVRETSLNPQTGVVEERQSVYAGPTNHGFGPDTPDAPSFSHNLRATGLGVGYGLEGSFSAAGGSWSYWDPIPQLNRTDADVTIFFLTFNDMQFVEKNDDPIFSAHTLDISTLIGVPAYLPDHNISAMACAEQHQYCNPNIAEGLKDRCTELTASELLWGDNRVEDFQLLQDTELTKVYNTSIHLNPFQEILAGYSSAALSAGMYFAVFSRGPSALKASETVYSFLQSPLPDNQWVVELASWFQVGLASIQQSVLEYATGPIDLGQTGVIVRPNASDELGQRLCKSQSIRNSGQVQSFSILGMTLIFALGGLIIIISLTMESTIGAMQRRWARGGGERRLVWKRDEKLEVLAGEGRRARHNDGDDEEMTANDTRGNSQGALGSLLPLPSTTSRAASTVAADRDRGDRGDLSDAGLLKYQFHFEKADEREEQRELGIDWENIDLEAGSNLI